MSLCIPSRPTSAFSRPPRASILQPQPAIPPAAHRGGWRAWRVRLGALALLLPLLASTALAQGTIIVPEPLPHPRWPQRITTTPLDLKYQRVYAEVTDGVAVTQVIQTFRNPLARPIEGTYVFPLPDNVAVGDFSMTVAGRTLKGEVLDRDKARQTYEQIVRRAQDPGLLEFLGSRLYQASLAPIPPGSEVEIKLQYSQALAEQAGMGAWTHPLRCQGNTVDEIESLVVQVKLKSTLPLVSVFCPTHPCAVSRPSDYEATLSFEQSHYRPDRDFQLHYLRKDARFGLSVLTHRRAGEPGYFLVRLSPRIDAAATETLPKDVAFIVDVSGSMAGAKIAQARRALRFCVNSLGQKDRFGVFAFSTEVRPLREKLIDATPDNRQAALDFADRLEAVGGTNIIGALRAALDADPRDGERPYLIVFMTDGRPTVEVTQAEQILKDVTDRNARRVRFHVLGVGADVNTELLDKLAEMNRGSREYCIENEDLELKLSALASRLAHPLLTDIGLAFDGLNTSDVFPRQMPDMFRGGELLVLGRYDATGHHAVRLRGRTLEGDRELVYEADFPARNDANDFLPRLWANRKVAYLLDEIRLHGANPELTGEVVRLAKQFGIVTPYTSALILEDTPTMASRGGDSGRVLRVAPPRAAGEDRGTPAKDASDALSAVEQQVETELSRAAQPQSGAAGAPGAAGYGLREVRESRDLEATKLAPNLPAASRPADAREAATALRQVGDKTFVLARGWFVDMAWDGKSATRKIAAFGDDYFSLIAAHPGIAAYLALGSRVLVEFDGVYYEIAPADTKPAGTQPSGAP